jgi:glycosyltransferase involved in cell wall biosynthesis
LIKTGHTNFKLLLKGTGDLYESQLFIENYLTVLRENNVFTEVGDEERLKANIIYLNDTLSYTRINDLFNAADLYISPYLAEGFNLTVLESISAGLPVLVPETGSTKEYIDDLSINFSDYIVKLKSSIVTDDSGKSQNNYDVNELYNTLVNNKTKINSMKTKRYNNYESLHDYIEKNYSWNHVSYLLFKYLKNIVKGKERVC